jgi:hypothetical protein
MKWEELRQNFSEEEIRQIDCEAIEELIEMDLRAAPAPGATCPPPRAP